MRAVRRASSTPPIALYGTSLESMSCCSAPVIPSTCAPTSPRCSLRHCRKRTAPASRASSATWSGSGWTRRIWRAAPTPDVPNAEGGVMEYVTLVRTGLRVSVAVLGCGKSNAEAVALVRQALDMGVNLLDTAAAYGTEAVVGEAIKHVPREDVVIATKAWIPRSEGRRAAERAVASLDNSLRRLGTDYVDIFQLHGVMPEAYEQARDVIAPALLKEQAKGKLRHLGVTEAASEDPDHDMLQRAVEDEVWDVMMVAFHMMHQNARAQVFPRTIANRAGTLLMFAVRNIFSRPERLASALRELAGRRELPRWLADAPNPLGFLLHEAGASNITEAAYRFARHEPGVDVVLFGTGDPDHLRKNIASLLAPPLPLADRLTLTKLFGRLSGVGLDPPYSMPGISSS